LAKNNIFKINAVSRINVHEALIFLACDIVENKAKIDAMNKNPNTKKTKL
jgi:hypothetical protein